MSKAFTKESDDSGEVTPHRARAPLPSGVPNYVTQRGLRLLRQELAALEAERDTPVDGAGGTVDAVSRRSAALGGRIAELAARVASANVLDAPADTTDEIRFGARVTVRDAVGHERQVRIVGVDEADAAQGLIAFVAPLARALLGRRVGETATVRAPRGEEEVEILRVDYPRE